MSETAHMMTLAHGLTRLGPFARVSKVCRADREGNQRVYYTATVGGSDTFVDDTPAEAVEALLDAVARRQSAHFDAGDQCATVRRMNAELDAEDAEQLAHRKDIDHE